MQQMQAFNYDDPFPSWIANALGKVLSVLASRFVVTRVDATHVSVVAGPNDQAAVISIGGLWRWVEATVGPIAHPGGAAGVYPVFATAKANNITNVPVAYTDHTDYSFGLQVLAPGQTPALQAGVVDVFRHVADVVWDGAAIIWVTQTVPPVGSHAHEHLAGGSDPLVVPAVAELPTEGPSGLGPLVDGQECYLAAGPNGERWHLRYNAGSASAHKWEFVGGARLDSGVPIGDVTTNSNVFVPMVGGPTLLVPAPGDYTVGLAAAFTDQGPANDINNMAADIAVDGADTGIGVGFTATSGGGGGMRVERRRNDLVAGQSLSVLVRSANSISTRVTAAVLSLFPIRLG